MEKDNAEGFAVTVSKIPLGGAPEPYLMVYATEANVKGILFLSFLHFSECFVFCFLFF